MESPFHNTWIGGADGPHTCRLYVLYVVRTVDVMRKLLDIFLLHTKYKISGLKRLSHEIDFKNIDENGQILALIRAAAGF